MKQLLSAEQLEAGVDRLAAQIREDYAGRPLMVVGVLTGSVVLLADLIRRIELPMKLGLVGARSYRGPVTRPGPLAVNGDLLPDVTGHDVLLVDDIFDTGHTLVAITEQVQNLGAASVRSLVLLRKQDRAEVDLVPDYQGFDIPDEFVVGYGLDFHDVYRNLPFVAALSDEEIEQGQRDAKVHP